MDARIDAALVAFLQQLVVDLQDLRLVTVELRHQTIREAEIGRTDIDAGNALDIEDRFHVLDRGAGLDHRDAQRLVVRGRLISPRRAVQAGADRAVAAGAARRVLAVLNEILGLFLGVHHRADHAISATVQHLADDARLVPRHPHHRRHRMRLHRLEAGDHRLIVLHAVLDIDGDAVEPALRHHLGREPRRNRQPAIDHDFAVGPELFDFVCHVVPRRSFKWSMFLAFCVIAGLDPAIHLEKDDGCAGQARA